MTSLVRRAIRALPPGIGALLVAASATAQWPPWAEEPVPSVVYPAILVDRASLPELDALLLDARDPVAYRTGHLPGAIAAPPGSLLSGAGLDRLALRPDDPALVLGLPRVLGELGLSGRETVVCYGDREAPAEAARLLWCLELAGHPRVRVLDGGLDPDEAELETALRRLSPTLWEPDFARHRLATPAWVQARFGRPHPGLPDWELLDLRGEFEWRGGPPELGRGSGPERGHIPQSHPVDPAALFRTDGRWVAQDSMRAFLTGLGPRPATTLREEAELVCYADGPTGDGALGYLAARIAGFPRVRWLAGGWLDWCGSEGPRTRVLSAAEVAARLETDRGPDAPVVLLDVRHVADWSAAHLPGAVQLAPHFFADSLDTVLSRHFGSELDRTAATLIAYCYGPGCVRSRNCTTLAAQAGFRDVVWLRGGLEAWIASGYEVVRERKEGTSWWIPRPEEEARPERGSRAGSESEGRYRAPDPSDRVP